MKASTRKEISVAALLHGCSGKTCKQGPEERMYLFQMLKFFFFFKVSLWRNMSRRESDERWCQKMLRNQVASLLLLRPQIRCPYTMSLFVVQSLSCVRFLCNSMDCSPPGSSVRGIFQARILEWVAIPFSRESSQSRDQTCVSCISCIDRQILHPGVTWEATMYLQKFMKLLQR